MKVASFSLPLLLTVPLWAAVPAADKTRKARDLAQVTVQGIVAAFKYNDARVDEYLADKTVEVLGTVQGVFRAKASAKGEKTGTRYVLELLGAQKLDVEPRVQCYFEEKSRKALAALEPGQQVVVRGKCKGMKPLAEKEQGPEAEPSLPPTRPAYGVVLVDCELVRQQPPPKAEKSLEKKLQ
jgi:tRNA_anti-like